MYLPAQGAHRKTGTLCPWALTALVCRKEKLGGESRLTKRLLSSSGCRSPSLGMWPSRRQQQRAGKRCVKNWSFSNNFGSASPAGSSPCQLTCCRHLTFPSAKPHHPLWIISDFTQCKAGCSVGPFIPDLWVPYILLWEWTSVIYWVCLRWEITHFHSREKKGYLLLICSNLIPASSKKKRLKGTSESHPALGQSQDRLSI